MRFRLPALFLGMAFVVSGCHSESTAPYDRAAADDAAQTLLHLADSLSATGGSPNEIGAYRGLAALLMGTGRLSSVTISVDGSASEYLATAQEIMIGCPPEAFCTMVAVPPNRFMSAWQKSNPRRMVQLFVPGTSFSTVTVFGAGGSFAALQDLLLLDGNGALYGGSTTSRSLSATTSDTPCMERDGIQPAIHLTSTCRLAEFRVAFDGVTNYLPLDTLFTPGSTATSAAPSHRVTMSSQQVHGAHVDAVLPCFTCRDPSQPGTTPPMTSPWRDSLTATLTASVGSDVTFTFTVKNTGSTSTDVHFNDAQQFDIRVWNGAGTLVWRWSAGQGFTQALVTRTLAAGESATYVAHWTPPAAGKYRAMAYLTSSSHGAVGFTEVTAP